TGRTVEAVFSEQEWFLPERSRFDYWRWSRGAAEVLLRNPHPFPIKADITFDLKSSDERNVIVRATDHDQTVLWKGETVRTLRGVVLNGVRLPPGDTIWRFETNKPAEFPSNGDPRKVTFSLRNLEIRVVGKATDPTLSPAKK
ncbi:MAG: hypothetical protein EBU32_09660, partial [Opitutaceae bacterium]|nr:hypothetical protein [Opitutaceae bacterium]